MKYLRDFDFKDKKVLIRVDFNVPMSKDKNISSKEDWRIKATLPSINYLLDQGAKLIILSHLGRPKGKVVQDLRLDPIAKRLEELLNKKVTKLNDCCGEEVEKSISNIKSGEIIFLENLRFYSEEKNNDEKFAKRLASYGEIYVNDAFSVNHRAHASLVGIPKYLPSCAGLLLEKEINTLSKVSDKPNRPLVVIIGGAKISTKIKFINKFLISADDLLLAGALANTVIAAKGIAIGQSVIEKNMEEEVEEIILTSPKLHLPVDAIASADFSGKGSSRIALIGNTEEQEMILDIGPDTIKLFSSVLNIAKTIIWNGPMGKFENRKYQQGTLGISKALANSKAYKIIGGGETIFALEKLKLLNKINHVSTGGGALLEYLAKGFLPGIEALKK